MCNIDVSLILVNSAVCYLMILITHVSLCCYLLSEAASLVRLWRCTNLCDDIFRSQFTTMVI